MKWFALLALAAFLALHLHLAPASDAGSCIDPDGCSGHAARTSTPQSITAPDGVRIDPNG